MGWEPWDKLVACVERQETKPSGDCVKEQLWTFLIGCGYAIAAEDGVAQLTEALTGADYGVRSNAKIWLEVLPVPPRKRDQEGETHLDLALGSIAVRQGTVAGIELDEAESPSVCFCEMKWYSDISCRVTHDAHRNQLARVIENALCFQGGGRFAEKVHVALVTPAVFREPPLKSRLYQYKFGEYDADRANVRAALDACVLEKNELPDWSYPDLAQRVRSLSLHWATYDELFEENLPDSAIAGQLKDFWAKYGNYQGRL
jgi:hypothetical protein